MKKTLTSIGLFLVLFIAVPSMSSCGALNSNGNSLQTISKVANVVSTAKQITSVLGPIIGLKSDQKTSFTDIFSDYITGSNKLSPLASTDKNAYKSQLLNLNKGTLGKLGNVLTISQYANLLGLGKSGSDQKADKGGFIENIQKKSGNKLSSDAISVLSGLLLN